LNDDFNGQEMVIGQQLVLFERFSGNMN